MSRFMELVQGRLKEEALSLASSQGEPESNCGTTCDPRQPPDPPNPFKGDGLLQAYCWALIHGPQVPAVQTIPPPSVGAQRWTHPENQKHWSNGVRWACQGIRCVTRERLKTEVGQPLHELMGHIRAAPKKERVKTFNRLCTGRATDRALTPLPMRQAEKLTRIARYKLNAKQRNEHIWPSQQAFWEGAKAATQAYTLAWQSAPSPGAPDEPMAGWYADAMHDALFFGTKALR